jgi:hypothetical protein
LCACKMTKPINPQKVKVPTALTGSEDVKCPVCGYDQFLTFAPDIERAKAEGFQHVIMGLYGGSQLHALPVRFWHCANCGYVLNFIGHFTHGEPQ